MKCNLPFVKAYRDRHGRQRYYLRKRGMPRVPLPGPPGCAEFLAAYQAALEGPRKTVTSAPAAAGSFGRLCREYLSSAEFSNLAVSTKSELKRVVQRLEKKHADKPVARLERQHVLRWRDDMADRPGAANTMMRTIGVLLTFAIDRGYRRDNPAQKIKMLKSTPWRAWTDDELNAFEDRWPLGTMQRTGYAIALYTAQRRADIVVMDWSKVRGDRISIKSTKTGAQQEVPMHPELQAALAAVKPRWPAAIVTGAKGQKLGAVYFGHQMAAAIEAAGLPAGCVLHGLRKTTARTLVESGCTNRMGRSITLHATDSMFEEYSEAADQRVLSAEAMNRWKASPRRKRTKGEGV
jgi:site-specific recombinase XerD